MSHWPHRLVIRSKTRYCAGQQVGPVAGHSIGAALHFLHARFQLLQKLPNTIPKTMIRAQAKSGPMTATTKMSP